MWTPIQSHAFLGQLEISKSITYDSEWMEYWPGERPHSCLSWVNSLGWGWLTGDGWMDGWVDRSHITHRDIGHVSENESLSVHDHNVWWQPGNPIWVWSNPSHQVLLQDCAASWSESPPHDFLISPLIYYMHFGVGTVISKPHSTGSIPDHPTENGLGFGPAPTRLNRRRDGMWIIWPLQTRASQRAESLPL